MKWALPGRLDEYTAALEPHGAAKEWEKR